MVKSLQTRLTPWLFALALPLAPLPLAAQDAAKPSADTVVATVGDTQITLGHMIALRDTLPQQYLTLDDAVLFKGILDQLVQQTALQQSIAGTESQRDRLTLENEARGFLSAIALRRVAEGAVTDAAIEAAYAERVQGLKPETEYHAAHILVDSEATAIEAKSDIDGGRDFADLAKQISTDGAAANGGDLGWFGKGVMVQPFEEAVMTMKPGEVKGPIQTDFGWHLIKLLETREAEVPTIDDLREELASALQDKALADHIAKVTGAAIITRPGDALDPALLKDATLLER